MKHYRQFEHNDSIPVQIARALEACTQLIRDIDTHTTARDSQLVPDDWSCGRTIHDAAELAHHELFGVGWLIQCQPHAKEFEPIRFDPSKEWIEKFCLELGREYELTLSANDVEKLKKKFKALKRLVKLVAPEALNLPASALRDNVNDKKKRGGRPAISLEEDKRRQDLISEWNRAREAGELQDEFCKRKKITTAYLTRCINWKSQQRRRNPS